jgi:hypothetical protein
METMQGQAGIYKGGKLICHFSTSRYDSANKSAAHIQGLIVKRIKKEVKELGADYAEAWVHYSVLPSGPFCTRGIGKVQP